MAGRSRVTIFDFDGTLADTAPMIRAIYSEMATEKNWRQMTDEDYERLRRGSLREARQWSGVHWWQFPFVVRSAKRLMRLEADKVQMFPGAVKLIRDLHADGVHVYILSRNSNVTIHHVLERYGITECVTVLRRRRRFLGSKAATIKELVHRRRYDRDRVWMIGDEVRDIIAAHRARVQSVAVTWGIQDETVLKLEKPTHIVHTVAELRKILPFTGKE